jgi:hypothetical protein
LVPKKAYSGQVSGSMGHLKLPTTLKVIVLLVRP